MNRAALVATLLFGCADRTELMLGIATDLRPTEVNQVVLSYTIPG